MSKTIEESLITALDVLDSIENADMYLASAKRNEVHLQGNDTKETKDSLKSIGVDLKPNIGGVLTGQFKRHGVSVRITLTKLVR